MARFLARSGFLAAPAWALMPAEAGLVLQAAECGSSAAQLPVGLACRRGDGGLEKNDATAAAWPERAATEDGAQAQHLLGCMHREGEWVSPALATLRRQE